MKHTWVRIYEIIAEELVRFYDNAQDKTTVGQALYSKCMSDKYKENFTKLNPWIKNFGEKNFNANSIDPLHIFASFNSWKISAETRKEKLRLYYSILTNQDFKQLDNYDIELDVFIHFPHIQITKVIGARGPEDQKKIWQFFIQIMKNAIDEDIFDDILGLKQTHKVYGVGFPSLTIFMFWVASDQYLPLDINTLTMLESMNEKVLPEQTWSKYSKLLKSEINQSGNLYRNLTYLAIDFKSKYSKIQEILPPNEIEEINQYFSFIQVNMVKKSNINKKIGVSKKANTGKFAILGIKPLSTCDINYSKNLEKEKLYTLHQAYEIKNDTILYRAERDFDLYSEEQGLKINIQAIVGKNAQGKSTIIELLAISVATIALKAGILKFNKDDNGIETRVTDELGKLAIEVFFVMGGLYKVICQHGTISFYQYDTSEQENVYTLSPIAINNDEQLVNLFYTIHLNYSLYSLNESDNGFTWLHALFHKNDAYQTPIVIEPYRDKGSMDINRLTSLAKQRLLARILEPFKKADNNQINTYTRLIEEKQRYKEATHLNISVDIDKIKRIIKNQQNKDIDAVLEKDLDDALSLDKNKEIVKYIIKYFEINLPNNIYEKISMKDKTSLTFNAKIEKTDALYQKTTLLYICNKIQKIAKTYDEFKDYSNDFANTIYLKSLIDDKTHITYKLHQAINFLKYHTVSSLGKVDIQTLSDHIDDIQRENENLKTITLIPPSIFKIDITLNNDIPFNTLSSGEKQLIYTITSIVYHLQNLASVDKSSSPKISYKYINIVLDEIELYFHPEYQRMFISNLRDSLENFSGLSESNIKRLNFLLITHSPFILSDIIDEQILFLPEKENSSKSIRTFGANIHELLINGFFMSNSIGEFALKKIKEIVEFHGQVKNADDDLAKLTREYENKKEEFYFIVEHIGEDYIRGFLKNHLEDIEEKLNADSFKQKRIAQLKAELAALEVSQDATNSLSR